MRYILFTSKLKPKSSIAYIYIYVLFILQSFSCNKSKKIDGIENSYKGNIKNMNFSSEEQLIQDTVNCKKESLRS